MWYSMSKFGSSTQYGWSRPSGTFSSLRRSTGTSGSRVAEHLRQPGQGERLGRTGRVEDADAADVPGGVGRLQRQEGGVQSGELLHG